MTCKLSGLFGSLCEPVVAARGGEIIYQNAAAARISAGAGLRLADIIPADALRGVPDAFMTEASLGGARYTISGAGLDGAELSGLSVFTFVPEPQPQPCDVCGVIAAAAAALREPLALARLASDRMLRLGEDSEDGGCEKSEVSRCVRAIRRGIFGAARVLNHIDALAISLSGQPPVPPEQKRFDLIELCRGVTRTAAHILGSTADRVAFTSPRRELILRGSGRLIARMLLCLIGNAFEHTPDGSSVRVSVFAAGGRTLITVTDDGGGLRNGAHPGVWERYRERLKPGGAGRGAGLGLSAAQAIARMHGGGAFLESREGAGVSVVVSLPPPEPRGEVESVVEPVHEPASPDGADEISIDEFLTELAELAPSETFSAKYSD